MTTGKRALVVTKNDFTAERDGGSKRTAAMVRSLESQGFAVDWIAAKPFTFSVGQPVEHRRDGVSQLRALGGVLGAASLSALKWYSPRAVSLIADLCRDRSYKVAVVDHSQLGPLGRIVNATVRCVSTHNVESELLLNYAMSRPGWLKESLARCEARRMRRIERAFVDTFDIVVTVSERDAKAMAADRTNFRAHLVTAPNGVDESFFQADGTPGDGVVFVGHLGWRPNIDAAVWMAESVWPEVLRVDPRRSLMMVGKAPGAAVRRLTNENITVEGDVESVIPYLVSARVATAPLRSAGGTRIKILEALATGTPVVSTSLGALGLEHLAGEHLTVVDSPREFAEAILSAASRETPRARIRALVEGYRWTATMLPFISAIESASGEKALS